jgi:hypothetical protein
MEGLDKLLQELVGDFPQKHPSLWKKYKANPRGNHISFLLGWHCQYTKVSKFIYLLNAQMMLDNL